jgi:hypothetical protein
MQLGQFTSAHLDILFFCFKNADFSSLIIEIFDSLINNSLDHLLLGMENEEMSNKCAHILNYYLEFYLKEEVLIQEFEQKMGLMISNVFNSREKNSAVYDTCFLFLKSWVEKYHHDHTQYDNYQKFLEKFLRRTALTIDQMPEREAFCGVFDVPVPQ